MKKFLTGLLALPIAIFAWTYVQGANVSLFTGPNCSEASQMLSCLNQIITAWNAQLASVPSPSAPRNYLDNGAIAVAQRGTGIQTCAVASAAIASANHSGDRWGCIANVTTGAGRAQVTTSAPTPPAGFTNSQRLYRTSGALTQPICIMQEIPTIRSTQLAGQPATLSFYAQALAGLNGDNGSVINAYIFTGTGSDEGFGTFTASPAVTPAWTGITSSLTQAFTITTAWVRYTYTAAIPSTATELAVALCFTPTATGAGTTDGFAFTGVQLEQGSVVSAFEFLPYERELATAQRYLYRIAESTSATIRGTCTNLTSSISNCVVPFPVPMRIVPTMVYTTGFGITVAAQTSLTACTANATSTTASSVASTLSVLMSCATSAAGGALGTSTNWGDTGGSGVISASADF